jgi:hypothetical protein
MPNELIESLVSEMPQTEDDLLQILGMIEFSEKYMAKTFGKSIIKACTKEPPSPKPRSKKNLQSDPTNSIVNSPDTNVGTEIILE